MNGPSGNLDPRTPVLVGAAAVVQRADDPLAAKDASELMAEAVVRACDDAGAPRLLGAIQRIAVPHGNWSYRDPARLVAERIGARVHTVLVDLGIPQQTLINDALRSIAAGALDVAVVVGGEALQRDAVARRRGFSLPHVDEGQAHPDERQTPAAEIIAPAELAVGLVVPVQQYAMIENALRGAQHQSIAAHRDAIAALWAAFDAVALKNPRALFAGGRAPGFIREPGPENRPLAFPYNKWHATQWTVDQAGALVFCSAAAARAHGAPRERWVFPRLGLESSHALSLSYRRDLHRWPAMGVLGRAAAAHLERPLASVEHVELYSCFPAAVRVQQRELGLPLDGVPTITGGMPFAGGPFNNFVLQATVAMAARVRADRGTLGLVSTVSGLLTKPGLAVWSSEPGEKTMLLGDLAAEARSATASLEGIADYRGPATVATYTVTYQGETPTRVVVIGDTPEGRRCVAQADDAHLAAWATAHELVGTTIVVAGTSFNASPG